MTQCKLCKIEKKLIKAHIIPDFIYSHSGMYDEKHRVNFFRLEDLIEGKKVNQKQTGLYDPNILCADCDNRIISAYEGYYKNLFYGGLSGNEKPHGVKHEKEGTIHSFLSNFKYNDFKLFVLSVLFRAVISELPFFSQVIMETGNIEILRRMVHNGNPGDENDFPFIAATFATTKLFSPDIIINPYSSKEDGYTVHTFLFGSMMYKIYEGVGLILPPEIQQTWLKKNGEFYILHFNDEATENFIKRIVKSKA